MLPGNFVNINLLRCVELSWAAAPGHRLESCTPTLEEGKWASRLPVSFHRWGHRGLLEPRWHQDDSLEGPGQSGGLAHLKPVHLRDY